jgi:hypothetical protein
VAQLAQRLGFDLADALARDVELLADFLERAVPCTETQAIGFVAAFGAFTLLFAGLVAWPLRVATCLLPCNHAATNPPVRQWKST